MRFNRLKFSALIIFSAAIFITIGFLIGQKIKIEEIGGDKEKKIKEIRKKSDYKFINPLLECDFFDPYFKSTREMEWQIKNYIDSVLEAKKASHVSVYYRDLNNGPWIGTNETAPFIPASLLKVPIMICVFKKAEEEKGFLENFIYYDQVLQPEMVPNIPDTNLVKVGHAYTVEDLIIRMIAFSDNEAKELLLRAVGFELINKVFLDLGINVNGKTDYSDFLSVKDYSSCFRLLYNATYLSKEYSEKALQILSLTSYKKGIVAGVDQGIMVSHKFGERGFADLSVKQLHDCGIVYIPEHPYLICIMTKGDDFDDQASIIAHISKVIFQDVKSEGLTN